MYLSNYLFILSMYLFIYLFIYLFFFVLDSIMSEDDSLHEQIQLELLLTNRIKVLDRDIR